MTSEIVSASELHKIDPVFGQPSFNDHEQIVFCNDKDTGLKAIIGIHNSVMGPALGGTRMYSYANEWDALFIHYLVDISLPKILAWKPKIWILCAM